MYSFPGEKKSTVTIISLTNATISWRCCDLQRREERKRSTFKKVFPFQSLISPFVLSHSSASFLSAFLLAIAPPPPPRSPLASFLHPSCTLPVFRCTHSYTCRPGQRHSARPTERTGVWSSLFSLRSHSLIGWSPSTDSFLSRTQPFNIPLLRRKPSLFGCWG